MFGSVHWQGIKKELNHLPAVLGFLVAGHREDRTATTTAEWPWSCD